VTPLGNIRHTRRSWNTVNSRNVISSIEYNASNESARCNIRIIGVLFFSKPSLSISFEKKQIALMALNTESFFREGKCFLGIHRYFVLGYCAV
jgi:hypothetical protein